MPRTQLIFLLYIFPLSLTAQVGGENTYEFLNLSPSARVTAMGGYILAIQDEDVDLGSQNPALLNPSMHNRIGASTVAYLANINYGHLAYARYLDSLGLTASLAIQYVAYGQFLRAEPNGNIIGNFKAGEYAFLTGASMQRDRFSYGAMLKFIYSSLESYWSLGLAADLGVTYSDTANRLVGSLVMKNVGRQLRPYREKNFEPLPFDLQVGISKGLKHLPFTFSLTYHDLHRFNIRYNDPDAKQETFLFDSTTVEVKEKKYVLDKFFRHLVFGGEMKVSRHLSLRIGYNHQRRKELTISDGRQGLTGFSIGAGIVIKYFHINYGRAAYHVAGASNHFGVSFKINDLIKKKAQSEKGPED